MAFSIMAFIEDDIVCAKTLKSNHLSKHYYSVLWKGYLKIKNKLGAVIGNPIVSEVYQYNSQKISKQANSNFLCCWYSSTNGQVNCQTY